MSDAEIVEITAQCWIDNGGDAEGLVFCWAKLRDRVVEILEALEEE